MKTNPEKVVVIDVMTCVSGTTTSSEAVSLFIKMKQSLVDGFSIKLSLINATPMSSSFLNASFGELFDQFGYPMIKERITLVDYKPSQAKQIKDYLDTINKLVK